MRRGIAMAGNHLMTELILSTGAVDMMIVDYQCIMPSMGKVAGCYHTKMISTSDKAQFPSHGAPRIPPAQCPAKGRGSGPRGG
jgi:carbon-monoxide dehydrogenase catalytic subunit